MSYPQVDMPYDELCRQAENYDYIRFTFGDIHGVPKCMLVPSRHFRSTVRSGVGLMASTLAMGPDGTGDFALPNMSFSNIWIVPTSTSISPVPWAGEGYRVGEIICEFKNNDGTYHGANPRTLARTQLNKLADKGIKLMSGCEVEFVVSKAGNETEFLMPEQNFLSSLLTARHEGFLYYLEDNLYKAGIDSEKMHMEFCQSQFEFSMKPLLGIEAIDMTFRCKQGIKELCEQRGLRASFMTKPYPGEFMISALQFNLSLWDPTGERNIMYDPSAENNMSDTARHFLSGLIRHTSALTALCCPTMNCYRRLNVPLMQSKGDWGVEDRMAAYRWKSSSPRCTYIEVRFVSSAANVYLVTAGMLAAGIDGIENKYELPPPKLPTDLGELQAVSEAMEEKAAASQKTEDEVKANADQNDADKEIKAKGETADGSEEDKKSPESEGKADGKENASDEGGKHEEVEDPNAPTLPKNLERALEMLAADDVISGALGEDLLLWFNHMKHKHEIKKFKDHDMSGNDATEIEKERKMYNLYM